MNVLRSCAIALVSLAILATSAAAQTTPTSIDEAQHVVERFELARGAGDVDAALANLSDTAVITVQNRTSTSSFTGSVQLRSYLQTIGIHFQTLLRSRPLVQGSSVTWTERDQVGNQVVDATVVAIVSAGQIVAITYRDTNTAGTPGHLAAASAAHEQQQLQIPTAAWPAGLGLFGLLLLTGIFAWPRRKASRSQLDGRLLIALQRDRRRGFGERKRAA